MKKTIGMALILCVTLAAFSSFAQAVRIDSSGVGDKRFLIAVPDFAVAPGLEALGSEMAQVVAYDLEFTGLFRILPRASYPAAFTGYTSDVSRLDFEMWRPAKIAYLAYAYVYKEGENVIAQCRLYDAETGNPALGQQFTARADLSRLVAHRFSEEIVRSVDGVPGIASSMICFSAKTGNIKELFVSDYDGYNARQVTKHNSISIKPKMSPDGSKIAYLSYKDRYPFLYILDLGTGKSTALSKNVGLNSAPSWSPDGRRLALTLSKDGNTEIYIKNSDGSGEQRLTRDRAGDTSPSFSPDGSQIVFVSDRAGSPQIYIMSADGSNVRRVSYQGGRAYDPVWSPDGKKIACCVESGGMQIFLLDVASGQSVQATNTPGSNESPSWSADSRHVIYYSTRNHGLWAVNANYPYEQHPINAGGMRCEGPSWGPRRQ